MSEDVISRSEATRNLYGKRFRVPSAGLEMTIFLFKQKTMQDPMKIKNTLKSRKFFHGKKANGTRCNAHTPYRAREIKKNSFRSSKKKSMGWSTEKPHAMMRPRDCRHLIVVEHTDGAVNFKHGPRDLGDAGNPMLAQGLMHVVEV